MSDDNLIPQVAGQIHVMRGGGGTEKASSSVKPGAYTKEEQLTLRQYGLNPGGIIADAIDEPTKRAFLDQVASGACSADSGDSVILKKNCWAVVAVVRALINYDMGKPLVQRPNEDVEGFDTPYVRPVPPSRPGPGPALLRTPRSTSPTFPRPGLGPGVPPAPVAPVAPVAPAGPVAPGGPVAPVAPGGPVAPVAPGGPVAPVAPAGPAVPPSPPTFPRPELGTGVPPAPPTFPRPELGPGVPPGPGREGVRAPFNSKYTNKTLKANRRLSINTDKLNTPFYSNVPNASTKRAMRIYGKTPLNLSNRIKNMSSK